jgi:exopolysaccharide biosynthesis polyprenyl glycosylphosphotransferase
LGFLHPALHFQGWRADVKKMSDAVTSSHTQPSAGPVSTHAFAGQRIPTTLESIRDHDETAAADAADELAAQLGGRGTEPSQRATQGQAPGQPAPAGDYARPADSTRLRVRWRGRALLGLVAADAAAGLTAALVVVVPWARRPDAPGASTLTLTVAGLALTWTAAMAMAGVHGHRASGHGAGEFKRIGLATVTLLAILCAAVLAVVPLPASGVLVGQQSAQTYLALKYLALIAVPLAGVLSLCGHAAARVVLRAMRARGRCVYRVVAVGTERSVAELIRATRRDKASGLSVVGLCVNQSALEEVDGVPVVGTPDNAVSAVRWLGADTILLTSWSDVGQEDLRRLSWEVEGSGVQLLVAPRLSGVTVPRLHLRTVDGSPLVQVAEQEFTGARRVAKAALDYGFSILITLCAAPVMIAVGLAVKLTSPGPVLFRQERVGRHGETFTMHKFRSMYVDAEARKAELAAHVDEDRGPMFKLVDDPRVTPVGRFIRRYSLDELPQLLDVVSGSMSLVGPRPPVPSEAAQYEDDVRRRLRVKPGMTGLWQVSGRSNLSWQDAVRLDLHYVENWSLTTDLSIMFRTVAAVLARDGAY